MGRPPPPEPRRTPWGWARNNLFSSLANTVTTLALIYLLWVILPPVIRWTILDATWTGEGHEACEPGGACWIFVRTFFGQFLFGHYPIDQRWRVVLGYMLVAAVAVPLLLPRTPHKGRLLALLLAVMLGVVLILFSGGILGLPLVETRNWGGLMITLVVGFTGIVFSLPLGILLAMGRMSAMPMVSALSTVYIEFWRGIPILGVLFMASVWMPLFLPQGFTLSRLVAVLIGVVLYAAAYQAETVRGGLQGVPRQQYDAAAALGLGYWRMMRLIILPQALRNVVPGIVNTFINLFKSSTLVLVVGLFDLVGMVQLAASHPNWLGRNAEGYVFAALVFWVICYATSKYSQALERRLRTGHDRDT